MKKIAAGLLFVLMIALSACTPPPTPALTAAPEATTTPSPTGTPLPPAILIHAEVTCLTTPQEGGKLVATFHNGDTIPVVGKDDYGEYWVVIDPTSGTGCWIPREGTSAQGIIDYLPNLVPPPTPAPRKPSAPGNFQALLESCGREPGNANKDWIPVVVLSWEDLSDYEDSFLIYRYGNLIGQVDRGETRYRDVFNMQGNGEGDVTYAIIAYSRLGGESEQVETTLHFQCK